MTLKECITFLLENQYGLMVGNEFVVTKKLNDEINKREVSVETPTPPQAIMPLKDMKHLTTYKEVWNEFIADCEIPHRVKVPNGSGEYTVRQYSLGVAKRLHKIIINPKVDYSILVESTKNYYKTVAYKALLSNYIDKDIWVGEYDQWVKNKGKRSSINDGSHWAEE